MNHGLMMLLLKQQRFVQPNKLVYLFCNIFNLLQERKLRERSEEYCRQLQAEVRTRSTSDFGSSSSISADASRMEIERLEASF